MPAVAKEIGPLYDLLLATRDGSNLSCLNKDGQAVAVPSLAFMTSVNPQTVQHEETELQHKDQLVQLASPNLVDREFDQWPQVSQGDWSGGTGQRVFTGATPITGGTASDPTRYWDGQGLLWPIFDNVPVSGYTPPSIGMTGTAPAQVFASTCGGSISGFTGAGWAALWAPSAGHTRLLFQVGATQNTLDDAFGVGLVPTDMCIGADALWALQGGSGTSINLYTVNGPGGTLTARLVQQLVNTNTNNGAVKGSVAAAYVGNRAYVAVAYQYLDTGLAHYTSNIRLFDVTNQNSFAAPSATDLSLPFNQINGNTPQQVINQIAFHGDDLIISVSGGATATIFRYNIPSQTFSTLAIIPGSTATYLASIVGGLFLVSARTIPATGVATVSLYLLQGSNLQDIGSIVAPSSVVSAISKPAAFGPYALFTTQTSGTSAVIQLYAYDVLRGRLFRAAQVFPPASSFSVTGGSIAVVSGISQTNPGNYSADWGVVLQMPTASGPFQELYWGVIPGASATGPFLQLSQQIISSLIDFTSAQNKLYRMVVFDFTALPNDQRSTVGIDVWLDQDPNALNVSPDFTSGQVSAGINGGVAGQKQLKLFINQVARKLVYRITTTMPIVAAFISSVKPISVEVRAAVGWTRTMTLDLTDNVMTNGKAPGTTCWTGQQVSGQPAIDGVVAYNFLRQLWRLRGGEVTATFPNGDAAAPWLLQDIHFDSPKPFGTSFRADQRSTLSYVCQVKLREDV